MSNDSKPRVMTVKGWLKKASGSVSATAFLTTHRSFLESGEVGQVTIPILSRLDAGEVLPTPALDLIKMAVLTHMMRVETAKADARILAGQERAEGGNTTKHWQVSVFDAKGDLQTRIDAKGDVVDLCQSFELASDADRWSDRRLFEGASDWYAIVTHDTLPIETRIDRSDAIARILAKPKTCASKKMGVRDGKLSFGVKAIQSRASFSHG